MSRQSQKGPSFGTLFQNHSRWWWRGILPGETERRGIPLIPDGAKYATKDYSVALNLAEQLIEKHIYLAQKDFKPISIETVTDLVRAYKIYIDHYYNSIEPKNIGYAIDFLAEKFPATSIEDFGPLDLKSLRAKMIEKKLARGNINKRIKMIVRMFKWGVSEQIVPAHIYQALATVENLHKGRSEARESKRIKPVSDAHTEAVLPYLSQTVADMVRLQRLSGMRSTEVCVIRAIDIDRTGDIWIYTPCEFKGEHLEGYTRKVALGPQAQAILRKYLFGDPQLFCFTPARAMVDMKKNRITVKLRYDSRSYRLAIVRGIKLTNKNILKQCKEESPDSWEKLYETRQIPHWHPHQIRHTHATAVAAADCLETAKAALGHRRLATTEIYAEKDLRRAIEAARRFG